MKTRNLAFLALAAMLSANTAHANWKTCPGGSKARWKKSSSGLVEITLHARASTFGPGTYWNAGLEESIDNFNDSPIAVDFEVKYKSTLHPKVKNGVNEVWFADPSDYYDFGGNNGPQGFCWRVITSWCEIREMDVVLNSEEYSWSTENRQGHLQDYGGSHRSVQHVMTHEMAHGLGMEHSSSQYSLMCAAGHYWTRSNKAHAYVGEAATYWAVKEYGRKSSNPQDVSVVHWKRTGTWEENTSRHGRTGISTTSRSTTSPGDSRHPSGENDTVYWVSPGERVNAEFTFENSGSSTKTVRVKYYLSTNKTISSGDTYLGSRLIKIGVNMPYTSGKSLTIPSNVQGDRQYWIGAIIDADEKVAEFNENNNTSYIPIHTR